MRYSKKVLDDVAAKISHMGLRNCIICGGERLGVLKRPVLVTIGGFHYEKSDPRWDPEANVLFMINVTCDSCGHVLSFDMEKLVPHSTKSLIRNMTEEEEEEEFGDK